MAVKRDMAAREVPYQGITIVSPMRFGEEQKDQDRARFFGPGQVACVCDGVTTSPHSTEAAELVTSLTPGLFQGDVHERLAMACDLLVAERRQFQTTSPSAPAHMSEAMQTMLRQVLQQKQATSYQTTMIAVRVRADTKRVMVDVLRCGDSAFFAFSADGELLSSSMARALGQSERLNHPFIAKTFNFGPGKQILVRIEGRLDVDENLAGNCGIHEKHRRNWVVCTPVYASSKVGTKDLGSHAFVVRPDDRLLVPRYLYGQQLESQGEQYRCLDYSSTIRIVPTSLAAVPADGIEHRGSTTTVLPDHFYSGQFDSVEDRFPRGTHFVLCSDGFYSAFATASKLWAWLQANRSVFGKPREQEPKLVELHAQLHEKSGDDDMSFVWMHPISPVAPGPERIESELEE